MSGFKGHRPSGKSSWPLVLVAGAEKTGKSYLAAEFSSSDLVGQMFWIEFGEHTAEHYGAVPGASYILADHDGTFNDVCQRAREAVAEPMTDGKPNVIVVDSVSMIWETLSAEAQQIANGRRKAGVDGEAKITSDVWNLVTDRWKKLLRILKSHNGPVILIARLDVVAVMDVNGQPTKERTQKVKAQKNLPYDVDVIVQIPEYRKFQLTGVRSLVLQMAAGEAFDVPSDFTLDGLMRNLGLAEAGFTEERRIVEPSPSADDALAEVGGQQERPMVREQRQGPVVDKWTNEAPATASPKQVNYILDGLREVRGIADDAVLQAAIEALVKRPVPNPFGLTEQEAAGILVALTAEHEAKQAAAKLSPKQRTTIQAHYNNVERDERLEDIERRIGRPVASTNDLSGAEASRLIDSFGTGEIVARANSMAVAS